MSWITEAYTKNNLRSVLYNKTVALNGMNLSNLVGNFDGIFNNFVNFTDEVCNLMMYPFIIPITKEGYLSTTHIKGGVTVFAGQIDTHTSVFPLKSNIRITPKFNNFADLNGYTRIKIYLPFLDFIDVDTNEVMNKYLHFALAVDYNTGKGMYLIGVSDTYQADFESNQIRLIGKYECQIGIPIPLGQSNWGDVQRNLVLGTIKTVASVGAAMYTGTLPPPTATTTTTTNSVYERRGNYKGARMIPRQSYTETTESTRTYNRPTDKSKPISEAIDGSVSALSNVHIHGTGDRINDSMLMWNTCTDIIIRFYRPKMLPVYSGYAHIYGKPLGAVRKLNTLKGYTVISSAHIEGEGFNTATRKELDMIESMLYNGVLIDGTAEPISFTLITDDENAVSLTAERGMTWATWVNSSYNTVGAYMEDTTGKVYLPAYVSSKPYITLGTSVVYGSTTITNGAVYSCADDYPTLSKPTISISGDTLTVTSHDQNTQGYTLYISGEQSEMFTGTTFNLSSLDLAVGSYDISVIAWADNYYDSPNSNTVIYTTGEIITFTMNDDDENTLTMNAISGMSWYEWARSEYNTIGAYIIGDSTRIYLPQIVSGNTPYVTYNSTAISYEETIISGATYGISADITMSV